MKILIIGSGRMGVRHALGVKSLNEVSFVVMADIHEGALESAKTAVNDSRFSYVLINILTETVQPGFDVCIIAATAGNRSQVLALAEQLQCKHIMVEKPLGQSMQQVIELNNYVKGHKLDCVVNLNMRLYDSFIRLKNDLQRMSQFEGEKTVTINTGTLGIGANGIHYLDLLFFILDADKAELVAGEIDDSIIPSGRGPQFGDFGGWAVIKFYKNKKIQGKALISMASNSTVFGSWEIVGPHGRIYFNEVEGRRIDTIRKEDSQMPVNRYFADYLPAIENKIESPFLGDLTAKWIQGIINGENLLPAIDASLKVHELLFDWLSKSATHKEIYPIT